MTVIRDGRNGVCGQSRVKGQGEKEYDLRPYYWYGVLVCFIAGILGAGSSGGGVSINTAGSEGIHILLAVSGWTPPPRGFLLILWDFLVSFHHCRCSRYFCSNVVAVGKLRYLASVRKSQPESAGFSSLVGGGNYLNVVKTMLLKGSLKG